MPAPMGCTVARGGLPAGAIEVSRDPALLAPRFAAAVQAALADCAAAGMDAVVHEGFRSEATQHAYWCRGRTVVPPHEPVTWARTALDSWHGYGLAVDVISGSREWDVPEAWYAAVAGHFGRHGCAWGGEWAVRDLPHFQWGRCRKAPSRRALELYVRGGVAAVWAEVGAA